MAKKRSYDIHTVRSEYEETLENQEKREAEEYKAAHLPKLENDGTPKLSSDLAAIKAQQMYEENYKNPDYEESKRISLFMEYETWERVQAVCWSEGESINKYVVDRLRESTINVSEDTLKQYREAMKEKHLDEWARQRDVLQYWWQTPGMNMRMKVTSYQMHRDSLTVVDDKGVIHNYYIHRGNVTDGTTKFAREKTLLAQMKRLKG